MGKKGVGYLSFIKLKNVQGKKGRREYIEVALHS